MKTQCPFCNQHIDAPDELEGQEVKCPSCHEDFIVVSGSNDSAIPQKEGMKRCMVCGKQVYKFDTVCPKCGNIINKKKKGKKKPWDNVKPKANFGVILIAIPVLGCFALNFLPLIHHRIIIFAVIISTAILAAMEASANEDIDVAEKPQSPMSFLVCILLLWIVGYPYYLAYRVHYGLKNLCGIGVLLALIFTGLVIASQQAINKIFT